MKYPLTIIAGIIAVIAISLGAIVTAGKADEGLRHVLYAVILAMAAPTVTTLLALLKSEKNEEKIDHNISITEQAKRDAEKIVTDLAAATEELAKAKAELAARDEKILHQINNVRQTAVFSANLNKEAIERGEKNYAEVNDINRKFADLRTDAATLTSDKLVQAVHDVDEKVVAVDQKASDILKQVEHGEKP